MLNCKLYKIILFILLSKLYKIQKKISAIHRVKPVILLQIYINI
jgi:hypothetical protein